MMFDPYLVLYLPLHQLDGASFMSRDAHGHLCTVTGAGWRPNGRYFDGMHDIISVPDHPKLNFGADGDFTIMVWFNELATQGNGFLVAKRDTDTGDRRIMMLLSNTTNKLIANIKGGTNNSPTLASKVSVHNDGLWHCGVFSCDRDNSSGAVLDLDGEIQDAVDPTGVGDISTVGRTLVIGASYTVSWFGNLIGEVAIWNRALPFAERQNLYLATKWRYK